MLHALELRRARETGGEIVESRVEWAGKQERDEEEEDSKVFKRVKEEEDIKPKVEEYIKPKIEEAPVSAQRQRSLAPTPAPQLSCRPSLGFDPL